MVSFKSTRSVLFSPGNDNHKLCRAMTISADLIVADLEDAVPDGEKPRARSEVEQFLGDLPSRRRPAVAVRINSLSSPHAAADLDMVRASRPEAIVVPKALVEELSELDPFATPPVIAIVETPRGLQQSARIAELPVVQMLMLGQVDLTHSLRLQPRADGLELLCARTRLVIDSAAADIAAPVDGVHTAFSDLDGLRAEAILVRSLGFGGKACIHPGQVEVVNRVFQPSDTEIEWARRVVAASAAASAQGRGASQVDGAMVDAPVLSRAQALLQSAASADVKHVHAEQ